MPDPTMEPFTNEAWWYGYDHGNQHDHPFDPLSSYSSGEKMEYWKGFQKGRGVWIAKKIAANPRVYSSSDPSIAQRIA